MKISIGGYPRAQKIERFSGGAAGEVALQVEPGAVARAGKPVCPILHGAAKVSADQAERRESRLGVDEQSRNVRQDGTRAKGIFSWQAEVEIGLRGWVSLNIQETEQPSQPKQTSGSQNGSTGEF